jgi:hypothetical protein
MYQVAVDIQQHFAVAEVFDDVCIPNLVKQCFTHSDAEYIFALFSSSKLKDFRQDEQD